MSNTNSFDGSTYDDEADGARLSSALQRVRGLLRDGAWHSLPEIRRVGGPSGDSRLRDLRKDKFGGYRIEARRVALEEGRGVWEYRWVRPASEPR
jgi:hypothetical protein